MTSVAQSIGGVPVTIRVAMKMEDSVQAFAVRAACFIGEQDGHDDRATHLVAFVGEEPVGTVRVRWFKSFAMCERLAVLQRFRGHEVGGLLLERCRPLAASRDCNVLYAQVMPPDIGYWEKQGWRRLVPEHESKARPGSVVSMVKPVDPGKPVPGIKAPEAIVLRRVPHLDASGLPLGALPN